jgi:hypothetical protein
MVEDLSFMAIAFFSHFTGHTMVEAMPMAFVCDSRFMVVFYY